jgi:hypothetical protein
MSGDDDRPLLSNINVLPLSLDCQIAQVPVRLGHVCVRFGVEDEDLGCVLVGQLGLPIS